MLSRRFQAQLRVSTRDSAILAGIVALVAFPAWSIFDAALLPAQARTFLTVRMAVTVPMIGVFLALISPRAGRRWPEPLAFLMLALPELAIAWMIPRTGPELEAYLLGCSLAVYGSGLLLVCRWQVTAAIDGFALAATAAFVAMTDPVIPGRAIATIAFYLSTASAIAIVSQVYRNRSAWQQFVTQSALEDERALNLQLVEKLRRLSMEDELTGVANLRAWDQWFNDAFHRAKESGSALSLIFCDLDQFKAINDSYGHALGDAVLRAAAAELTRRARVTDFVARLGGDEFVVACPDTALHEASVLAHDLAAAARSLRWPRAVKVTLSCGVAVLHPDDASPAALLGRADVALYRAKSTRDAVIMADMSRPPS